MSIRPRGPWCSQTDVFRLAGRLAQGFMTPVRKTIRHLPVEAPRAARRHNRPTVPSSGLPPARAGMLLRGRHVVLLFLFGPAPPEFASIALAGRGLDPAWLATRARACRVTCSWVAGMACRRRMVYSGIAVMCCHRSHFGSRYTLGRCASAGLLLLLLFSKVRT